MLDHFGIPLDLISGRSGDHGNTDGSAIRARCARVARVELDGTMVVVSHGDQFGSPTPTWLHAAYLDADLIIYGHTHRPVLELVNKTVTVMNPGSVCQVRPGQLRSVGILDLEPGLAPRGRLVPLESAG